jgi:hypothetical protein
MGGYRERYGKYYDNRDSSGHAGRTPGLAAERGDRMDSLITRLLRDERARRMGAALAERRAQMTADEVAEEQALIAGSAAVVAL